LPAVKAKEEGGVIRSYVTLPFSQFEAHDSEPSEFHEHLKITAGEWEAFLDDFQQTLD